MNRHDRRAAQAQHKSDGLVKIPLIIGHDMRTMLGADATHVGRLAVDKALDSHNRQLPIAGQHSFTVLINAANGTELEIVVALDNEKQTLACGFPSDFEVVDKETYEAHYANRLEPDPEPDPEGYSLMTVELLIHGKIIALGGEPTMARAMAARVAELTDQPAPANGSIIQVDCSPEKTVELVRALKVEFPDAMGTPIDQRVHDLEVPQH